MLKDKMPWTVCVIEINAKLQHHRLTSPAHELFMAETSSKIQITTNTFRKEICKINVFSMQICVSFEFQQNLSGS